MRRQITIAVIILILVGAGIFWLIRSGRPNQTLEGGSGNGPAATPTVAPTGPNQPFSFGRVDECCAKGWAYDNNQAVEISITTQSLDYPGVTRTFTGRSTDPQNQFLFHTRNDVLPYLESQGVTQTTNPLGFTVEMYPQLYPGRHRISKATYNGKPMSIDPKAAIAPFSAQWTGGSEPRYNPAGAQYIQNDHGFDTIFDPVNNKQYPIKPRADLQQTYNARWSPNGKFIAFTYKSAPQPGYAPVTFNVMTPQEAYRQQYTNPGRVLMGGQVVEHHWLDNNRVVAAQLTVPEQGPQGRTIYGYAILNIYNAATDTFEHPMRGYMERVYEVKISPNGKLFMFQVPRGPVSSEVSYVITDVTGREIRRTNDYSDTWYQN